MEEETKQLQISEVRIGVSVYSEDFDGNYVFLILEICYNFIDPPEEK